MFISFLNISDIINNMENIINTADCLLHIVKFVSKLDLMNLRRTNKKIKETLDLYNVFNKDFYISINEYNHNINYDIPNLLINLLDYKNYDTIPKYLQPKIRKIYVVNIVDLPHFKDFTGTIKRLDIYYNVDQTLVDELKKINNRLKIKKINLHYIDDVLFNEDLHVFKSIPKMYIYSDDKSLSMPTLKNFPNLKYLAYDHTLTHIETNNIEVMSLYDISDEALANCKKLNLLFLANIDKNTENIILSELIFTNRTSRPHPRNIYNSKTIHLVSELVYYTSEEDDIEYMFSLFGEISFVELKKIKLLNTLPSLPSFNIKYIESLKNCEFYYVTCGNISIKKCKNITITKCTINMLEVDSDLDCLDISLSSINAIKVKYIEKLSIKQCTCDINELLLNVDNIYYLTINTINNYHSFLHPNMETINKVTIFDFVMHYKMIEIDFNRFPYVVITKVETIKSIEETIKHLIKFKTIRLLKLIVYPCDNLNKLHDIILEMRKITNFEIMVIKTYHTII